MIKARGTRLNKFISHNSNYSRREADRLFDEGKIEINSKVVKKAATLVKIDDIVKVNDKIIKVEQNKLSTIIVYNKNKGELVTKNDPMKRKTIFEAMPHKYKHFTPIGRLDYASEGVLLLTDDVKIANALMHSNLERTYKIKISGKITQDIEDAMQNGLKVDDATKGAHKNTKITSMEFAPFSGYQIQTNTPKYSKLKVIIQKGQNRELRRFFGYFNTPVLDLKRIDFGGIELNNLPSGKTRFLTRKEYQNVREFIKAEDKIHFSKQN
jgi:23S rRNA pseudouridine2605 synthase